MSTISGGMSPVANVTVSGVNVALSELIPVTFAYPAVNSLLGSSKRGIDLFSLKKELEQWLYGLSIV